MTVDLNEYLKKSIKIDNVKDLFEHYDQALEDLNYSHSVFIFFGPKTGAGETLPTCPYFDVETEIIDQYINHQLYHVGPVFEKAKVTGVPIVWSEFLENSREVKASPKLKEFIDLLHKHGYQDGITIPVFGFSNSFGHFSFSHKDRKIDPSCEDLVVVNHICMNLFKQYLRLTHKADEVVPSLTIREKEVLGWVVKGKSNSVIAEIMGISEHTVTTYIRRSASRLGSSSKLSTAITAVLMGIIQY